MTPALGRCEQCCVTACAAGFQHRGMAARTWSWQAMHLPCCASSMVDVASYTAAQTTKETVRPPPGGISGGGVQSGCNCERHMIVPVNPRVHLECCRMIPTQIMCMLPRYYLPLRLALTNRLQSHGQPTEAAAASHVQFVSVDE
jgi:hypothetical protein